MILSRRSLLLSPLPFTGKAGSATVEYVCGPPMKASGYGLRTPDIEPTAWVIEAG